MPPPARLSRAGKLTVRAVLSTMTEPKANLPEPSTFRGGIALVAGAGGVATAVDGATGAGARVGRAHEQSPSSAAARPRARAGDCKSGRAVTVRPGVPAASMGHHSAPRNLRAGGGDSRLSRPRLTPEFPGLVTSLIGV